MYAHFMLQMVVDLRLSVVQIKPRVVTINNHIHIPVLLTFLKMESIDELSWTVPGMMILIK